MKKPIEIFKTKKQLNKCLRFWKKKLFLENWIIKAYICKPDEFEQSGNMGENSFDMINKCCVIRILDHKYYGKRVMKYCAEKVLVHELLHCKYNWVRIEDSYENKYFDVVEHGILEEMAKSLIMLKYNLDLKYFKG